MVRITGISTPVGGANWEFTDDDSATMYIAVLLESKRLLTMPWSRAASHLPFELDVEYCFESASELKESISSVLLRYHKVSPPLLSAMNSIIHALNDFLDDVALVRNLSMWEDRSNQQQTFQCIVKRLKEKVSSIMEPLLKNMPANESSDIWKILNNRP